jgi:3-oxoacyl-[acyl-carrier-protein] synthase-3
MRSAFIRAVASYLPPAVLTNEQLSEEFPDYTPEKIFDKTGIKVRHIAAADECASDLGVAAAKQLFDQHSYDPADVDFLLFCTQAPDYFLPTTACLMQDRLGLSTSCGAVDINQGCSGFVYGLSLAKSLVEAGTASNVLLITADTYSKFINPRDKSVKTLFGDGAAATLVSSRESDRALIGPFVFGTDGSRANDLIVPAGGMRRRIGGAEEEDEQGNRRSDSDLYMDGAAIFGFTLKTVPEAIGSLLQKAALSLDDIDFFIPHSSQQIYARPS